MHSEEQSLNPGELFRILVLDASEFRTTSLKIQGGSHLIRHISTREEGAKALLESWDVALHSGFLGNWNEPYQLQEELSAAAKAKRLRGVIVYNPLKSEGRALTAMLLALNVPTVYMPYDFSNPSSHQREVVRAHA